MSTFEPSPSARPVPPELDLPVLTDIVDETSVDPDELVIPVLELAEDAGSPADGDALELPPDLALDELVDLPPAPEPPLDFLHLPSLELDVAEPEELSLDAVLGDAARAEPAPVDEPAMDPLAALFARATLEGPVPEPMLPVEGFEMPAMPQDTPAQAAGFDLPEVTEVAAPVVPVASEDDIPVLDMAEGPVGMLPVDGFDPVLPQDAQAGVDEMVTGTDAPVVEDLPAASLEDSLAEAGPGDAPSGVEVPVLDEPVATDATPEAEAWQPEAALAEADVPVLEASLAEDVPDVTEDVAAQSEPEVPVEDEAPVAQDWSAEDAIVAPAPEVPMAEDVTAEAAADTLAEEAVAEEAAEDVPDLSAELDSFEFELEPEAPAEAEVQAEAEVPAAAPVAAFSSIPLDSLPRGVLGAPAPAIPERDVLLREAEATLAEEIRQREMDALLSQPQPQPQLVVPPAPTMQDRIREAEQRLQEELERQEAMRRMVEERKEADRLAQLAAQPAVPTMQDRIREAEQRLQEELARQEALRASQPEPPVLTESVDEPVMAPPVAEAVAPAPVDDKLAMAERLRKEAQRKAAEAEAALREAEVAEELVREEAARREAEEAARRQEEEARQYVENLRLQLLQEEARKRAEEAEAARRQAEEEAARLAEEAARAAPSGVEGRVTALEQHLMEELARLRADMVALMSSRDPSGFQGGGTDRAPLAERPVSVLNVASVDSASTAAPARAFPRIDETQLTESLHQKIMPHMKVELSLWLQDALESQAKQMMGGVMHQLKEDYEMLVSETLRESLRQAVSDMARDDKGGRS